MSQGGHLSPRGPGGRRGRGRPAEQHARVRDPPFDLHGHGGVCRRAVCQQAGPRLSGLRHSLHPGRLRRRHHNRRRRSGFPVSSDDQDSPSEYKRSLENVTVTTTPDV